MRISDWSSDVCSSDLSKRPSKDINGKRKLRHMIPASARDDETESTNGERSESRLAALARNLVETVGVEGAIRYCSSLGWRGVLREVELLRRQQVQTEIGRAHV